MTTIFADAKKGVMESDSMASYGDSWFPITKVYRVGDELVGWAGQYSEGPRWIDWYATGQRGKMPSIGNISVLILGPDGLRIFEPGGLSTPIERGWLAVGSGASAAMGAFRAGADPKKAVEIACEIDSGSGGAVVVHKLK